jgi:hypothetical protein
MASDSGTLVPGPGAFFDYDLAGKRPKGERVQFHAMVRLPPGHDVGTLIEIFDAKTGITRIPRSPCGIEDPTLAP